MNDPMNIHHIFHRTRDGEKSLCMDRKISPAEALKYFVAAELAFGSTITLVEPDRIETYSKCMNSVDVMSFTGPWESMVFLHQMALVYKAISDKVDNPALFIPFTKDTALNKELSAFMTDMNNTRRPLTAAIWFMLANHGAVPDDSVALKTALIAFELIFVDGQDPGEVFELCEIKRSSIPDIEVYVHQSLTEKDLEGLLELRPPSTKGMTEQEYIDAVDKITALAVSVNQ